MNYKRRGRRAQSTYDQNFRKTRQADQGFSNDFGLSHESTRGRYFDEGFSGLNQSWRDRSDIPERYDYGRYQRNWDVYPESHIYYRNPHYQDRQWRDDDQRFPESRSERLSRWWGDRSDESMSSNEGLQSKFKGKGPKSYKRSDQRIEEDVNDILTDEGALDASNIDVKVIDGDVTLTGTVSNRREKRLAEDIAESVSGVRNVQNQIRVSQGLTENDTL
jgi:osmotically-inducible protein OsmY